MIRRNRELFQNHTVRKTRLDLNEIVRDVAILARARLQANHAAFTKALAELPAIDGDRVELQQLLLN